jgi:hypothetical protein
MISLIGHVMNHQNQTQTNAYEAMFATTGQSEVLLCDFENGATGNDTQKKY